MSTSLVETALPMVDDASSPHASQCAPGRAAREFVRYFVASGGALAVDFGLYRLGLAVGLTYPLAALAGFCAGAVVAYLASIAWVFEARSVRRAGIEFGVFVAIGAAGLALTEGLLWLQVERFGFTPLWSKVGAAGVVFLFNFAVRKTILFRHGAR